LGERAARSPGAPACRVWRGLAVCPGSSDSGGATSWDTISPPGGMASRSRCPTSCHFHSASLAPWGRSSSFAPRSATGRRCMDLGVTARWWA
jgi:hypothetical protein